MLPVNPSRGAAFRSTSSSVGFMWDGGNGRKTLTLITTPLAGAQLALLLHREDLDGLRQDYPEAYRALADIKEILDDLVAQPLPSARAQWDAMRDNRNHLLAQLNEEQPGGSVNASEVNVLKVCRDKGCRNGQHTYSGGCSLYQG